MDICTYKKWIHFAVYLKLTQHWKSSILQKNHLKNKTQNLNKETIRNLPHRLCRHYSYMLQLLIDHSLCGFIIQFRLTFIIMISQVSKSF